VPASKTSNETIEAYATTYCRTNLKLPEKIATVCCEENEVVKLKTKLNKSFVEQSQNTLFKAKLNLLVLLIRRYKSPVTPATLKSITGNICI
jgi:hypothetical protein